MDTHLRVKLQPQLSDGCEGDLFSTQSHSLHNVFMLQCPHQLSVDLQQHFSILHTRPLSWTAAVNLAQNVNCIIQTDTQILKSKSGVGNAFFRDLCSHCQLTCAS